MLLRKFVVSTTSVSASQCARAVAEVAAHRCGRVRTAVERDDPRVVNHLLLDRDVLRRLHDQEVVVVAAGQLRHAARDTALGKVALLGVVVAIVAARGASLAPPLAFRRERRHPAVRRIDDERGLLEQTAFLPPELVVGARVAVRRRRIMVAQAKPGELLLGVELLHAERGRPLQRSLCRVVPDALQVGTAVRGPRHGAGRRALAGDDLAAVKDRGAGRERQRQEKP